MRQTLEETSKINTERFTGLDADLNALRADLQLVQQNAKKGGNSPGIGS